MNKKQYEHFKKHVKKQCQNLCIDYHVTVEMEELASDRAAQCCFDVQNRYAEICLDSETESTSLRAIEITATHEVLELLLSDIREALCVFYNIDYVDKMIHRVIRKLESKL